MKVQHSEYLKDVFGSPNRMRETAQRTIDELNRLAVEFDSIAVRGVSGVSLGSVIAYILNKRLIVVRKHEDNSHASVNAEGLPHGPCKYIVVDDFMSSGNTVANIIYEIRTQNEGAEFVGVAQYNEGYTYKTAQECKSSRYVVAALNNDFCPGTKYPDGKTYWCGAIVSGLDGRSVPAY